MRLFAVIPLLLTLIGFGLSYADVAPALVGWGVFFLGALLGLVAAITILVMRVFRGHFKFLIYALIAILPFAVAVPLVTNAQKYPPINDVTTNLDNPPVFVSALKAKANAGRDMAYPKEFAPIVREHYPDVSPLILEEAPEAVFLKIEKLVKAQPGWVIKRKDEAAFTLELEVSTSFFRFTDDVLIQVSEQDGKARVDMRSKSRDGVSDIGVNAKRIQAFFAKLSK